jgi:hypothetical protein
MDNRIMLEASEGMLLTNGEIFAKVLVLGNWDSADNYFEIPEAEYYALTDSEVVTE